MVLVQKWPFFQLVFIRQNRPGKFLLRYSRRKKKTAFLRYKNKKFKKSKIDIFPFPLTHGFGPKMAIFPACFCQAIYARKMSFTILQNVKTTFQDVKIRSSKSRKVDIFPNPWFWSQNGHFSNLFFLRNRGQEKVFYEILERKKALPGYKNKKFKKSKN